MKQRKNGERHTPCIEPVGSEEHWEEEENHRIRLECDPETHDLSLP